MSWNDDHNKINEQLLSHTDTKLKKKNFPHNKNA